MPNISFLTFREKFIDYGCFSIHQVLMWDKDFDANNYTRWVRQGLLVRLRRGWFAFPELLKMPDFAKYVAGRIYRPSYISLHAALSYYAIIPEAVTDITSVTTLKTSTFENRFGRYSYQTVKQSMFFGFEVKPMADGRAVQMATPEKALLDLLYLYPIYSSEDDMRELRLDETFMEEELDREKLGLYLDTCSSAGLDKKTKTLYKAYGL